MNKLFFLILFTLSLQSINAQDSTATLSWSGYAETYYTYDFNKPDDHNRPGFFYSHNRHNEFNLNLGYIKAAYSGSQVRANLALAAGSYMNANYAAEPGVLKNVFEANAGVRLSKKQDLWLDAGIFSSHIGFESAVSKDCRTLTRSILADNSPYFESGAKLSYTSPGNKWMVSILALNGWQRIKRVDGNSMMSWGAQVQFKPSPALTINYSNFYGTDSPDSLRKHRFFHNFYLLYTLSDKADITLGLDAGTEQKSKGSSEHNSWYSPVAIIKYAFNPKWAVAGRWEYYSDKNGVIIPASSANGFRTQGYSVNIDHSPKKNISVRAEFRQLSSRDAIFIKAGNPVKTNSFISSSIAVSF